MLVATLPPYARHRREIAEHPLVSGLRFNTINPVAEDKRTVLRELKSLCGKKPLWIDLKGRQLRITKFAYLPHAFVEVSHRIKVKLPAKVLFKEHEGKAVEGEVVRVVDGNKLILADRPWRVVGAGEPVNILDPSLEVDGYLTADDEEWVEAAASVGIHDYMLSFFEQPRDCERVCAIDRSPDVRLVAKVESRRGVQYARDSWPMSARDHLMAARDDLLVNMGEDRFGIVDALATIIKADPEAICASRVLTSLEDGDRLSMGDVADLEFVRGLGYRNYMLSDGLCFKEHAFRRAMAAWASWSRRP